MCGKFWVSIKYFSFFMVILRYFFFCLFHVLDFLKNNYLGFEVFFFLTLHVVVCNSYIFLSYGLMSSFFFFSCFYHILLDFSRVVL